MKKILLFITLISFAISQAQIVNIPDANFKSILLSPSNYTAKDFNGNQMIVDTNGDSEIQNSEAENVYYLNVSGQNISDLTGIDFFINLKELNVTGNLLTSLDLTNITSLEKIICRYNNLTSLSVYNLPNLEVLRCSDNQLTTIAFYNSLSLKIIRCGYNNITYLDVSSLINLEELGCTVNQLQSLDVSNLTVLNKLWVFHNDIKYLSLTNTVITNLYLDENPNIKRVCCDVEDYDYVLGILEDSQYFDTTLSTNCNRISGLIKYDYGNNDCNSNYTYPSNVLISTNNTNENISLISNGYYNLPTNESGIYTTSLLTNLPSYFNTTPLNYINNFTSVHESINAPFCIKKNQTVNDVNISLIPTSEARPGFNTTYQLVYRNIGTTQLNGNLILEFDDTKLNFLNANETISTQTTNTLTFDYTNLTPFETRTIDLVYNINSPSTTQPVNIGDILSFTTTINPIADDFTTDDNTFELNQTVIGSYDPNDIICLEGDEVLLANVDKYLHYVIRFQNTGTASAINVVITNDLDTNLDWSTLQIESLSHNNRIAIKNGNEIEFIFENINLPDSTTDEPNSHGFIAYKIKPKTDIALGDIIPNKADIFFDFNEAIETNTETTEIVNVLAVNENTLLDFSVYPTPTKNILNIKSKTEITKIEIYSKLGQLIKNTTENQIDISNLTQGLYFVKVENVNGNFGVKKIVKR